MYGISKITKNIYVGGIIEDYSKLSELGIKAVINCRAEQHDDTELLTKMGISYYWIPLADALGPRRDQFDAVFRILDIYGEIPVLVHCTLGVGRSPCLVGGYMIKNGMDWKKALRHLQIMRPEVDMSENQVLKLKRLEERLK